MPEKSIHATQTFYNRWAALYDHVATAPGVTSWRSKAVETLSLSPGDTVVEMGCGTGANFPSLRSQVGPAGQVIGIDLVPGMLDQARRRIQREGWENVHVIRGDATSPPIGDVDALLSTFVVGMLDDPAQAVRDWVTLVRPGGRVTIMNAGRSNRLVAKPLNLLFRLFVRLSAPGYRFHRASPTTELEQLWELARGALFEGTVEQFDDRFGLGFIVLASGTVPE